MRVQFAATRVLVSDTRDHTSRIDNKQNKTALTPKQEVGDLDDLIMRRAMDEAFGIQRWTAIFAILGCDPCCRGADVKNCRLLQVSNFL